MNNITQIQKKTVMTAVGAGLVPRTGLQHLLVGRKLETEAVCRSLDQVAEGGAAFRIITGPVGAGKTFFQHLNKVLAIENGLVVVHADLKINHRLHGADGKAQNLYEEWMTNLTTKSFPEGGGLRPVIETWISNVVQEIGDQQPDTAKVKLEILKRLRPLKDYVGGNEFATVLGLFYEGFAEDKPQLQEAALRYLRAAYRTITEAKQELKVHRIIRDADIYDTLKLLAAFLRIAGYKGLIVMIDELSALTHRLPNAKSRQGSFEVLLTIINECFQGNVKGLAFILAGTPEAVYDPDRGLYSYPPLRSRLKSYNQPGLVDYSGPVIKLTTLGPEELLRLIENIRNIEALGDPSKFRIPDEGLRTFLDKLYAKLGPKWSRNPRDVARPFVSLLHLIEHNPTERWQDMLNKVIDSISKDLGDADDGLEDFNLK